MKPNRGYKRNQPHRDARLFVIVCEGEKREREYFEHIQSLAPTRIRLAVLQADASEEWRSAPKWLLDRAAKYAEEDPLSGDDQLWFVMDVDRWKPDMLRQVAEACVDNIQWNIAISNRCFEVWLYMHIEDIAKSNTQNCRELKKELGTLIKGGYKPETFIAYLGDAIRRAEKLDKNPAHYLPAPMQTKMYRLAKELVKFLPKK